MGRPPIAISVSIFLTRARVYGETALSDISIVMKTRYSRRLLIHMSGNLLGTINEAHNEGEALFHLADASGHGLDTTDTHRDLGGDPEQFEEQVEVLLHLD